MEKALQHRHGNKSFGYGKRQYQENEKTNHRPGENIKNTSDKGVLPKIYKVHLK